MSATENQSFKVEVQIHSGYLPRTGQERDGVQPQLTVTIKVSAPIIPTTRSSEKTKAYVR